MSDVPAPPGPPPPASGVPGAYPVGVAFDRSLEVARWRPLVNWLLGIPQLIIAQVLGYVANVLWFLSFFTVLFAKKNPFLGFQRMVLRYRWRTITYVAFMREEYPPFDFDTSDRGGEPDAASLTVADPGEMNRWLVLVKWILVIPHVVVLVFLGIGAAIVWLIAFFAVLFTGKWPQGMRDFVVGVSRWGNRVGAYMMFLTDEYPPFRLDP